MKKILLDIPDNILIIAAGIGIYNTPTIEELVGGNSDFSLEDGKLYVNTTLEQFLIAGIIEKNYYINLFSEEQIK